MAPVAGLQVSDEGVHLRCLDERGTPFLGRHCHRAADQRAYHFSRVVPCVTRWNVIGQIRGEGQFRSRTLVYTPDGEQRPPTNKLTDCVQIIRRWRHLASYRCKLAERYKAINDQRT